MRILLPTLVFLAAAACAQPQRPADDPEAFADLVGAWTGTLTYTDYGDDASRVTLPLTATATAVRDPAFDADGLRLVIAFTEPDGSSGGTATATLTRLPDDPEGFGYDSERWPLTQYLSTDGLLQFVIERDGEDNDRPARIRHTITYREGVLTDRKEVRYEGTEAFFERNTFRLTRE